MRWIGLIVLWLCGTASAEPLVRAPSPVDNPLKGLVPYARPHADRFPHSMEFSYVALSDLMFGMEEFRWEKLESLLNDISSRGNHAIVRVYLEYPGHQEGIPEFLVKSGLKVHQYQNTNTAPFPPKEVRTPDYSSPILQEALTKFITAWGARYDGDPRVGYITAGLLGTWGEWHTYPRNDLWASKETQLVVLKSYERAFHQTPVLLRYPAGEDHWDQASNAQLPFGYHDDSFAWATLDTGRKQDNWFFVPALHKAKAAQKWKVHPIGGEIRPEVWGKIFDDPVGISEAQDFERCVQETHVSWLMDSGMFEKQAPAKRYERAVQQVRKMGYDFYVREATLISQGGRVLVKCEVVNEGVAPFYRDWRLELGLLDSEGKVTRTWPVDWKLTGIMPGEQPQIWTAEIEIAKEESAKKLVALHAVNPLPGGKPLRFANASQDKHAVGWLSLGTASE